MNELKIINCGLYNYLVYRLEKDERVDIANVSMQIILFVSCYKKKCELVFSLI